MLDWLMARVLSDSVDWKQRRMQMEVTDVVNAVGGVPTMSSQELADLTGKEHRDVLADIRKILIALFGEEGIPRFEDTQVNLENKKSYQIFRLPKRECLILISGYSAEFHARIIERWQELEAPLLPPLPDFTQPAVAARAWADQYERAVLAEHHVAKLEAENEAMAAKIAAFEAHCDTEGTVAPNAKSLKLSS